MEPRTTRDLRFDGATIVAVGAILAAAVRPFVPHPFVDDWVYAWSVERLLSHGELRLLEWSSNPNVVQILWGTLFALPGGFSFAALRVSTWVLAVASVCLLYVWLRSRGVDRGAALLGAATLGANPAFVVLAGSFMTDVPFLFFFVASAFAAGRACRTGDERLLALGSLLACFAVGVRVVGAALPLAMAVSIGSFERRGRALLIAIAPLAFLLVLAAWAATHREAPADLSWLVNAPANRLRSLVFLGRVVPQTIVFTVTDTANVLGIALLPLAVASVSLPVLRRAVPFLAAFLGFVLVRSLLGIPLSPALAEGWTWSFDEVGATLPLVPGHAASLPPPWWLPVSTLVWAASIAVAAAARRRPLDGEERFVARLFATQLALIAILWLFYDRYVLPLVPLAVLLVLGGGQQLRRAAGTVVVGLFAVVAILGHRDHLEVDRALWAAVADLDARGVRPSEVDAGYVVNGWRQYAHPENAPRDAAGRISIPWLNGGVALPYAVSSTPLPGWRVLATFPYERCLASPGATYVLARRGAAAGEGDGPVEPPPVFRR